jgi:gluconokinase
LDQSLILALDIGTSSVRSALYNANGNVLPATMVKNERRLAVTEDGGAEIDADKALDQVIDAVDDVLSKRSASKQQISHVASSAFWHSLVGIDAKGKPTTKVFGWADTRSRAYVSQLRQKFEENQVHNRTGARFHSSFWPAKLFWLRQTSPETFHRTAKWISLSDYVALKLFGTAATSVSMASGTGLFDIRKCAWDSGLLKFLRLKAENMPTLPARDAESFRLTAKYARRWPQLKEAEWFPAIGDGAANNVGAGCVIKNKAALMIGTSGAMRVAYRGEPPANIPSGLWCYRIDREHVIIGGALSDGGGLFRWLKDNLNLTATNKAIEKTIARRRPDGHGLTFLPFVAGERGTGYHESATGAVLGLRSTTDAVDIVQAAMESVAYRFAEILDQLNSVLKIDEIIASGGALRQSPLWTQMIANVLGRDLSLPDTREASSRGAVLLALETIGKIESIEKARTPKGKGYKSAATDRAVYASARKRHQDFYATLIENFNDNRKTTQKDQSR